ncbi:hypothetical protein M9H77_23170 [Catharanthus roseus]|uniref:Uncharacterized protein n=1 Tax=Catharanthus roseus TaxID=4058 RepID=A0ACC0ATS0_CATRO|nr:hypothetical protein M9H77_23170 [Catharanthus roseus]
MLMKLTLSSESLCVQNFEDSSEDEGGKLAYKSIKTINFFPSNSFLSIEIYFKEIELFSLALMENGYQFCFLNSLGTLLEKKQFIEFNSISCAVPRVDEYHFDIANFASCVLGVKDRGRNMEKELGTILEDLSISLSLNPSLCESYLSRVSIIGDTYAISFGCGFFLVVPSTSKCVSSYYPLKNQLVINDISGEPSCFDCELVHDESFFDAKVVGFLDIFMNDFVGAISLNLSLPFLSNQVEFLGHEQKLSNVIESLYTLFENTFGFPILSFAFQGTFSEGF